MSGAMRREEGVLWRLGFCAALLGLTAFGVALLNGFVYDDHFYVAGNTWLRSWSHLPALLTDPATNQQGATTPSLYWRPLRNLSYLLDWSIAGGHPAWFHFVNLLWHGAAVIGLYGLTRRLHASTFVAFAAAAIFAVHPAQTETVVWIKERDGLMAAAFLFWALYHAAGRKPGNVAASIGLLIAALLSKESAIVYTPLVIGLIVTQNGRIRDVIRGSGLVLTATGATVTVGYLALRQSMLGFTGQMDAPLGGTTARTVWTAVGMIPRYLGLTIRPADIPITYDWIRPATGESLMSWLGVLLLAAACAATWSLRRRRPLIAFGIFFYLVSLLPYMHFVTLSVWMADRFLYIPMAGAAIAVADGIAWSCAERRLSWRDAPLRTVIVGLIVVAGAFMSMLQTLHWRSDLTLWEREYRKRPDTPRTAALYASHLVKYKHYEEALRVIEEHPIDGRSKLREVQDSARISALLVLGRTEEALDAARNATQGPVLDPRLYALRGAAASRLGRVDEAMTSFEQALKMNPFDRAALRDLADLYDKTDRKAEAEALRAQMTMMETRPRGEWRAP